MESKGEIAKKIGDVFKNHGISIQDVADKLGISRNFVYKMTAPTYAFYPSFEKMYGMAIALGINPNYILGIEKNPFLKGREPQDGKLYVIDDRDFKKLYEEALSEIEKLKAENLELYKKISSMV